MLATCLLADIPPRTPSLAPRRAGWPDCATTDATWSATNSPDNSSRPPSFGRPPPRTGYTLQARHICQDLDLWRRRLAEIEHDIEDLLDTHEVGKLLLTIDGIGPQSVARIIAAVGDPARFTCAAAFAAYVGVVPGLRQSGKRSSVRAAIAPLGNARLRMALWMPVLGAVRRNPWLRAFYERLRAAGKPAKLALIAAMRKLMHAIYSVAKNRRPFTPNLATG